MTAHHPQLLKPNSYRQPLDQALLDALVNLNEYLHELAFRMRGAVAASGTAC